MPAKTASAGTAKKTAKPAPKFSFNKELLSVEEDYVPWSAVEELDDKTVIPALIDSISTFKDNVYAVCKHEDHILTVLLFDYTKSEAMSLIGKSCKLVVYTSKAGKKRLKFRL